MRVTNNALLLALACMAAVPVSGHENGDVVVRAGLAQVAPDVGADAGTTGIDVDNGRQLGLTAT